MVWLSIWERRAFIAPKIDIDNALHLAWHIVMTDPEGEKLEVLEEMQSMQRGMIANNGKLVEDLEVKKYVSSVLSGFREIACGKKKGKVIDEGKMLLSSLTLDAPPAKNDGAISNNPKLIPQITGFYYPIRTLKVRGGVFEEKPNRPELEWWESIALHNFSDRDHSRPAIRIDPACVGWLSGLPVEYKRVLSAVSEYRGDWSRAAESPKLIGEYGKETVDRCVRDMKEYAKEKGKVLSIYGKFLEGNGR